jgi:raffinose/stachyose/melibiose transport system substrate-binding protein
MGFFPVPGANAKVYAFGDGTYQVNANSKNLEAAHKVLDFTATKEFAELFVKLVGELPAYGGEYTVEDPRLKEVAKLIATNSAAPTPFFAYALNKGEPSYGTLVADGYQALLSGSIAPADLARKIQDGLNSWGYVGAANCK